MMDKTLQERMLEYEDCTCAPLSNNTPIILRVDGRAFHTFTRRFEKPFDMQFVNMMNGIGIALCKEIMNAKIAYLQSDEISILIYGGIFSDNWFGNKPQKMVSVSASLASTVATYMAMAMDIRTPITFDSRVFAVPEKDVCNYFVWRQRDWERNSLQMVCRSHYSQKQMTGKSNSDMHELLHKKGVNWNDLPTFLKRGRCIKKTYLPGVLRPSWEVDEQIPIFTKERDYIESHLMFGEMQNE